MTQTVMTQTATFQGVVWAEVAPRRGATRSYRALANVSAETFEEAKRLTIAAAADHPEYAAWDVYEEPA